MAARGFSFSEDYVTRTFLIVGFFMFALLLVTLPAAFVDDRMLNGVNVWWKPLKFDLAILIHAFTLAILAQQMEPHRRNGFVMRGMAFIFVAAALFENVYIALQAMRGRLSHYNFETSFEIMMYTLMGLGALILILVPFIMGLYLVTQRDGNRSGYRLGSVIGLILGPILTLVFAGYMSTSGSHFVNAPDQTDAGGIFLFGWSREVGDLRPAHFFALHMIQFLPIIGLVFDRIIGAVSRPIVMLAALANAALATGLFMLALSGKPVLPF